jgi:Tfp pilus assembly protein PilO
MAVGWRANYLRYKSYFLDVIGHYQKRDDIKMFLELMLSLAAVSIFGIFAIRPTLIAIAELLKEIEGKKQVLAVMNEKIENLNQAQAIYGEEKANIDLLKVAIPKKGEPDVLVRQFEGVASQNPVSILSLGLGEVNILGESEAVDPTRANPLPEGAEGLSFTISSSSDYPLLASFVQALERLRRPYKLDNLYINTAVSAEAGKQLILVINARSPYLK